MLGVLRRLARLSVTDPINHTKSWRRVNQNQYFDISYDWEDLQPGDLIIWRHDYKDKDKDGQDIDWAGHIAIFYGWPPDGSHDVFYTVEARGINFTTGLQTLDTREARKIDPYVNPNNDFSSGNYVEMVAFLKWKDSAVFQNCP